MDKHVSWSWAIHNSINMVCWTILAIAFDKWWIALFAGLFWSSATAQIKYMHYRYCDKCGKHGPYASSKDDALAKANAEGWLHVAYGNKDYCPECRKEME